MKSGLLTKVYLGDVQKWEVLAMFEEYHDDERIGLYRTETEATEALINADLAREDLMR